MDAGFMEEYYDLKYNGTLMLQLIEENAECRELYGEVMQMEGIAEDALGRMGKEYLQIHGRLFHAKGKMDECIMRLAYLKGAQDREKMLR